MQECSSLCGIALDYTSKETFPDRTSDNVQAFPMLLHIVNRDDAACSQRNKMILVLMGEKLSGPHYFVKNRIFSNWLDRYIKVIDT